MWDAEEVGEGEHGVEADTETYKQVHKWTRVYLFTCVFVYLYTRQLVTIDGDSSNDGNASMPTLWAKPA